MQLRLFHSQKKGYTIICIDLIMSVFVVAFFGFITPSLFEPAKALDIKSDRPNSEKKMTYAEISEFIDTYIGEISDLCRGKKNIVVTYKDEPVLCIWGSIRAQVNDRNSAYGKANYFQIAYVSSPGGDIEAAIEIGLSINKNEATLIVDQHCHSACGNYLIPAARRIYMTDNTVISIHGSLPRSLYDFVNTRRRAYKADSKDKEAYIKEISAKISELVSLYPQYVENELWKEIRFFADILKNEAYITRYFEVLRTLNQWKGYRCVPDKGLYLIVGPEYLKEFNIKGERLWFPDNPHQYLELLKKTKIKYSFIYDFDVHPFWVTNKGVVDPKECLPIR